MCCASPSPTGGYAFTHAQFLCISSNFEIHGCTNRIAKRAQTALICDLPAGGGAGTPD